MWFLGQGNLEPAVSGWVMNPGISYKLIPVMPLCANSFWNNILPYDRWISAFLHLNTDKTDFIVLNPNEERQRASALLDYMPRKPTSQAKNLGVMIDSDLNFNRHNGTNTKSAY